MRLAGLLPSKRRRVPAAPRLAASRPRQEGAACLGGGAGRGGVRVGTFPFAARWVAFLRCPRSLSPGSVIVDLSRCLLLAGKLEVEAGRAGKAGFLRSRASWGLLWTELVRKVVARKGKEDSQINNETVTKGAQLSGHTGKACWERRVCWF